MAPLEQRHDQQHGRQHHGRLVFAHGFTQTARSWDQIASHFADAIAVDLPGHAAASEMRADLWDAADHLVAEGGPATYVGYSMGGRTCLHAALAHPNAVRRLVLIGATAGIDDDAQRSQRRASDEALADGIEANGVATFIDRWLDNPLFAGLTEETAQREDRLRNTAHGLASSLRQAGTGTQQPLWDRLSSIDIPVLLLVGERDRKFTAIAERMRDRFANASLQIVADAGHSVHLEQPDATVHALRDWLDQTP